MHKRLDISDYTLKHYFNNMYINLRTGKIYIYFDDEIALVKNNSIIRDILNYLIKNYEKYKINKNTLKGLKNE
jgi:hypothetical protein